MSSEIPGDTLPTHPKTTDLSSTQPAAVPQQEFRKRTVILLGILLILVFAGVGSWLGYQSGVAKRLQNEQSQVALEAATQFQLGLQDQAAGRLESAQTRFEYVISLDPNFPGITEKLTEVMVAIQATNAPTPVPTPTLSPTPDTRGEQELFSQIQQAMANSEWQKAIDTMDSLRAKNLSYRAIDVDGMYYIALRNLGIAKINNADLEGGIYMLTLAERFAPLDNFAAGLRTWTRYYLNGASFWEVDWTKVIAYFSELAPQMPYMRDSSGMTATERYRIALYKYADQLAKDDPCKAAKYYADSLAIGNDPKVAPNATKAADDCHPPTATLRPQTSTPSSTPSMTGGPATDTPTTEVTTPVPPPAATETPTPTPTPPPPEPTNTETPSPTPK
jgi:tetratricopeptide (TPR) repeat protein